MYSLVWSQSLMVLSHTSLGSSHDNLYSVIRCQLLTFQSIAPISSSSDFSRGSPLSYKVFLVQLEWHIRVLSSLAQHSGINKIVSNATVLRVTSVDSCRTFPVWMIFWLFCGPLISVQFIFAIVLGHLDLMWHNKRINGSWKGAKIVGDVECSVSCRSRGGSLSNSNWNSRFNAIQHVSLRNSAMLHGAVSTLRSFLGVL